MDRVNFMENEVVQFFVPLKKLPTVTHQEKKVHVVKGKPVFYEPDDLKKARALYMGMLSEFKPKQKLRGAIRLTLKFLYYRGKSHHDGEYKVTKPDLDNNIKLIQDCLTKLEFWEDDRFVASLIIEKFWAEVPGIFVRIEKI